VPFFICPNCQARSFDEDGREGLSHQTVGCHRCGFGFLFQLLEDYFPRPGAGFLVCDRDGRILAIGKGAFEVTGHLEKQLIGQPVADAIGLQFDDGDPIGTTLEWGVRQLDKPASIQHAAGFEKRVIVDLFPAYDDDGGLLVALSPV
jgi:PAS domain-containing protein